MPYVSTMLPVLLPIALFVVTLIIIFTLRSSDKRSKSLNNVKKLLDMYKSNIEDSDNNFKQYASELEQIIAKKDAEVKDLIQTVNSQLGELRSYSEDLVRLKNSMETYREALEGLARLTNDADDKVQTVQNEVDRLDKVRGVIDGFRQDMKDADEHLRKHEQRVIQLERESVGRMNDAVSETDSSMDEAMAGLHRESEEIFDEFKAKTDKDTELRLRKIDDAFQAVIHTVQQFFGELEAKIDEAQGVADRLCGISSDAMANAPMSEIPSIRSEVSAPVTTGILGAEIAQVADQAPKAEDMPKADIVLPKFKAPVFTPKQDNEIETEIEDDVQDESEYVPNGPADDFAAFGGVADENSDFRGMDIMDMDFSSMSDARDDGTSLPSWVRSNADDKPKADKSRWETYGEEEVIRFDDDSSDK